MIWLVPLVPLVAGRVGVAASALFAAAVALTQSWFPGRWRQVLDLGSADWLVLSRNLVLVAMTALLVLAVRLGRDSPTKATEASSTQ
jgi:ABC-type enterochelin transport system permease subunit